MQITLLIHEDEAARDEALQAIDAAIAETGVEATVDTITVRSDDDAKEARCLGSPTIRVNGYDVEYAEREPPETSSGERYYSTMEGWVHVPHPGMISYAIREALNREA